MSEIVKVNAYRFATVQLDDRQRHPAVARHHLQRSDPVAEYLVALTAHGCYEDEQQEQTE